ncbi:LacI family DNA-binding transcriptional regulator [Cellulomonas sp. ATA003]|uniref:LacI family DNA-binding transcriptional regulator n=1 Tax=Cellulomonas sp. ATA003 TaxID=3073064 RepID=UPI002872F630|nr:LacI family DNA-binding transcriptional regulator [Cellulomonas sp. ATA003]WNB86285.1 LacI family DNA-binding transcriptional regulator [Cellulomonas sp. ATA003]
MADSTVTTSPRRRAGAPTLEEVAELAGVSRSTASRAINGGLRVSPEAQASVDAAIAQLGFTPNRAARSLVTRRSDSVALVVPEPDERVLTDPFFAGTLNGLSGALAPTDLQLVLLIVRPGDNARATRYLRNGHVDGAIVVSHHQDNALDRALADSHLPHVFVGRPLEGDREVRHVDLDNRLGGRIATEHLVSHGRRRIGTLAGPQDMAAGLDRLVGWHDALRAAGLPDDAVATGDFTVAGGAAAATELLDRHPDIDALFAASDLMAVGALSVLAERGLTVPDDVAVVGYDNLGVAESTKPPLTTITNPVVAMARRAGQMLVDQLAGSLSRPSR